MSAVKVKGRDDGCCGLEFLKYVLFTFNFIFWLSGFGIVAIGIWTIWDKYHYVVLLTNPPGTYAITTYMLLGTGGLIILIGFLGCCGAWKENRYCLMTYAAFLLLIFLLEGLSGFLAYMYEASLHDELVRSLNSTMLQNYMADDDITNAIDMMQQEFSCCGAGSYMDWRASAWRKQNPNLNLTTPNSCCKSPSEYCAASNHPSNIFYNGCIFKLEIYLKHHLIILGAVGLGVCCLQIFGIVFACCLAKRIKEWKDRQAQLAW